MSFFKGTVRLLLNTAIAQCFRQSYIRDADMVDRNHLSMGFSSDQDATRSQGLATCCCKVLKPDKKTNEKICEPPQVKISSGDEEDAYCCKKKSLGCDWISGYKYKLSKIKQPTFGSGLMKDAIEERNTILKGSSGTSASSQETQDSQQISADALKAIQDAYASEDLNTTCKFGAPLYGRVSLSGKDCTQEWIKAVPHIHVKNYIAQVPAALVLLGETLRQMNFADEEGIFRIPGSVEKAMAVQKAVEEGTFEKSPSDHYDLKAVGTALKKWMTALPDKDKFFNSMVFHFSGEQSVLTILKTMPWEDYEKTDTAQSALQNLLTPEMALQAILHMKVVQRSCLAYFLDLIKDVVDKREQNLMDSANLAMVFAPNLLAIPEDAKDKEKLAMTKLSITFTQIVIDAWIMFRGNCMEMLSRVVGKASTPLAEACQDAAEFCPACKDVVKDASD